MNRRVWMPICVSVFVLLASVLVGDGKPAKDTKNPPPNYYPLQKGNEWRYQLTVGGNTVDMVSRIGKIETIDGKPLARLDAEVNGKAVATEHLSQTEKGVFRHRNNGIEIDPPLCLLRYPAKAGDKWNGKVKVGKEEATYECKATEENIEIGLGKFKTIRVDISLDSMGQVAKTSYWFVKDTGFVKQTVDAGGLNIQMELQKFQLKKDEKKDEK